MFQQSETYKSLFKAGWVIDSEFGVLAINRDNFQLIEHSYKTNELIYLKDLERLHEIFNYNILEKEKPTPEPFKFYFCYNCWCREKKLCEGSKLYNIIMEKQKRKLQISRLEIVIESKTKRIKMFKSQKTIDRYLKAIEGIKAEIQQLKEVK